MGCSNCNQISTCTCSTTTCGCSTILDSGCVQYTGSDLNCLGVTSGNKLEAILGKVNDAVCKMNNIESGQAVNIGNTLFVSKEGVDGTGERQNLTKHFLTVQAALAKALSGDTIVIYPGVYDAGSVTIVDKSIAFVAIGEVTLSTNIIMNNVAGGIIYLHIEGEDLTLQQSDITSVGIFTDSTVDINIHCKNIYSGLSTQTFIDTTSASSLVVKADNFIGDNLLIDAAVSVANIDVKQTIHSSDSVYAYKFNAVGDLDFNVDKIIGSGVTGCLYLSIEACTGKARLGKTTNMAYQGLDIITSKIKIYDTSLLGNTTESFGILRITGLALGSSVLVEDSRIESTPSNAETFARNVVCLGEEATANDVMQVKFKNTTIVNRSTSSSVPTPNLNTGCVGYLGIGGTSAIETWYQNCYLFSASLFYFTPYDTGAAVYMGDGATINCIGGNMTNAAKVAVIVDATFTFAGSFTTEAALIKEMLFDIT